jgi:hypothetical protein
LPRVPVPRAFTLTEAMVGVQPRKARSPWIVTYLRGATVVAAMMLVILVGGDLFLRSAQQTPQMIALQAPVETRPVEKVVKETAVVAPTVLAEETRPVEASQPVTALAAVPEATQPVQRKVVEKAAPEAGKATEEAAVEQPKTAEVASPMPEPVREFPRGGGGVGGAGGPGGGEGGETGPGGSSDLGPGVEPIPTEAPPQPDKAASEKSVREAAETGEPTVRSARAVEATPTVAEKVVEKAITPTPGPEERAQATITPLPTLEAEKTAQPTLAPTPTVTPSAATPPMTTPSVQLSPTASPTETPAAVALAPVEPTPESIAALPAQVPEQTQRAAPQPFAWEMPLRIAEFSLGILIILLLAASWIAARRA